MGADTHKNEPSKQTDPGQGALIQGSASLGTPFSSSATRVLMLGAGELGKEVVIELQRLGVEVIACDRYDHAPAMQVADRSYTFSMLDGDELRRVIEHEKPDAVVPEIEAIATATLVELEAEGFNVVPSARAAQLTMNREGIRRLAAEELKLATSPYRFAQSKSEYLSAVEEIGLPCVIKPIMSSSGKGQSTVETAADIEEAWQYAQEGGRAGAGKVIIEGFVPFDYEITLLTVVHADGTSFCEPIGHRQQDGDYRESWQPQSMSATALAEAKDIAAKIASALGGRGLFGVELFVRGDQVSSAIHLIRIKPIRHISTENRPTIEVYATILIAGIDLIPRKPVIFETNSKDSRHFRRCKIDNSYRIIFLKCCESRSAIF